MEEDEEEEEEEEKEGILTCFTLLSLVGM